MININNLFVVIDPSTDQQYALQRAIRIARVVDAKIHAYLCIFSGVEAHDPEALRRVETARYEPWLESMVEPARAAGLDVTTELEWSPDWREAIGIAAERADSDLIVKSSHRRTAKKRLMMTSSDMTLLESANCSVQLVSTEVVSDLTRALIALDPKREDEKDQSIFQSVVTWGKAVKESAHENGELHAVYAYTSSDEFRNVGDVAKRSGIDPSHIHQVYGRPEEAIVEVANEIDAQIIIIGLSTKSTLTNRIFGSMMDRLLNNIDRDILVVIPDKK